MSQVVMQSDIHGGVRGWWRLHRRAVDNALVAVALAGIVVAVVIAIWTRG